MSGAVPAGPSPAGPGSPVYWDARYTNSGYAYGEEPNAYLAANAHRLRPGGRVLVPGDGEGRNGVWLAAQGFAVTTVDMSEVGCRKAAELALMRGTAMTGVCADLALWTWPVAAFDAVAAVFLHLPAPLRATVHGRMRDALAPGGLILVEAFRAGHEAFKARQPSVGGPGEAALLYDAATLRADFAPLTPLELDETETELREGAHHHGRGAIVHGLFGPRA